MTPQATLDRHEPTPAIGRPLPQAARRALTAMYTGLALTVLAMAALVFDLASTGVLADHLHQVYDGYVANPPDEAAVAAYLFGVGGLGVVGWLWTVWAVRRRKRWARPVATALFVVATAAAVAHLTVTEYGQTILPIQIGLASLVPCIPGLVAVVELWTRRET